MIMVLCVAYMYVNAFSTTSEAFLSKNWMNELETVLIYNNKL